MNLTFAGVRALLETKMQLMTMFQWQCVQKQLFVTRHRKTVTMHSDSWEFAIRKCNDVSYTVGQHVLGQARESVMLTCDGGDILRQTVPSYGMRDRSHMHTQEEEKYKTCSIFFSLHHTHTHTK